MESLDFKCVQRARKVLPSVHEVVGGKVSARDLRDVRIEELLGRKQVETDLVAVAAMLGGRRVLVTGAGGSIGSEIAARWPRTSQCARHARP